MRTKHFKEIFSYFTVLQLPPIQAAIGAAELYRGLRKKGMANYQRLPEFYHSRILRYQ